VIAPPQQNVAGALKYQCHYQPFYDYNE